MRSTLWVIGLSLLLVLTTVPSYAGPLPIRGPVGPNVNISKMLGNQNETAVAVNPTNPYNIVVTSNLEAFRGLFKAYSLDGGLTWTTDIIADGDELGLSCCDSSLAFDSYGNLFLTYLQYIGADLPVAISTDGGATFHMLDRILPRLLGGLRSPAGRGSASPTSRP